MYDECGAAQLAAFAMLVLGCGLLGEEPLLPGEPPPEGQPPEEPPPAEAPPPAEQPTQPQIVAVTSNAWVVLLVGMGVVALGAIVIGALVVAVRRPSGEEPTPGGFRFESLDVGVDALTPVDKSYADKYPYWFAGPIYTVRFDRGYSVPAGVPIDRRCGSRRRGEEER